MQTTWNGFGVPADNCVSTDIFTPRTCCVTLSETPGVVTQVTLSGIAHAVNLWTSQEVVWYAIDTLPGPIPPPTLATLVDSTAFRPGAVLFPGGWQQCVLPLDGLAHTLNLVSEAPYVTVQIVMLEEMS
jgi:hypothetical protein